MSILKRPSSAISSPISSDRKKSKPGIQTLTVGSDFSGMDMPVFALKALPGIQVEVKFCSDNTKACRKFLEHFHAPVRVAESVQTNHANDSTPTVDIYTCGFPCQSFSRLGLREGENDKKGRGLLVQWSLDYITVNMPRVVIFENVANIKVEHAALVGYIEITLKKIGYVLEDGILNTLDFGIPQSRKRWFLVGILKEHIRCTHTSLTETVMPKPLGHTVPLSSIITRLPLKDWSMFPAKPEERQYVMDVCKEIASEGRNPYLVPAIIDIGSSQGFRSYNAHHAPCSTKTRCSGKGYWCSSKGGPVSVREFMLLHGLDPTGIDGEYQCAGVTECQMGSMLGNTMSCNVLKALLPAVLFKAKLITKVTFDKCVAANSHVI